MIRVTIWNENWHERMREDVKAIYPEGMHGTLKKALGTDEELVIRTATLEEPEHGLTQEVLDNTDVLTWWGHVKHNDVSDEVVARVVKRVWEGMGLIVLHSGHGSKVFQRLCGTPSQTLPWRDNDRERIWIIEPSHPIAQGLPPYIELEHEEMYGERFNIPTPDALVMISWFAGGEVFRSGACFTRGNGRIFYFRPGHEECPTFHNPQVQQVIRNAIHWAAPGPITPSLRDWVPSPEKAEKE